MKKLLSIVIMCFLLSVHANSANFNWSKIATTDDGNTTNYLDKSTVYKSGSYNYYWQMANYNDENEDINSVVSFNMANCNNYEMRVIIFISYSGKMGNGNIIDDLVLPEASKEHFVWNKFPDNSIQRSVVKKVCKLKN
tara:strand:+ start:364 stop:777 length:414 start_codon:yes stop_codon:yes gene_type:complete